MRCKSVFILSVAVLLLLAACKTECKKDADCIKQHFTGKCVDKKCSYIAVPNECGNGQCEEGAGENKCTCAADCGQCIGKVPNTQFLTQQCIQNMCIEDVQAIQVKPIYSSVDQSYAGDKFKIDTIYNLPFNLKKDTFDVAVTLTQQAPQNKDAHLLNLELIATTKDRRTITLARQDINKYLWTAGSTIKEEVAIDFPTAELEGELTGLVLKIQYEYSVTQAGKKTQKQGTLQARYEGKFIFAKPTANYPCPKDCNDKNPGTRDYCGAQTNYFCKHEPIAGACGNFKCDGSETKCSCLQDCGHCSGSAGNFLDYTCQGTSCITILKTGATVQQVPLFDDRSLGPVQLQNNYKFNTPFNIKTDKIQLDFTLYRADPTVSHFTLETVRLLEGQQQLAEMQVDKELGDKPTLVSITIPSIVAPEEEHQPTLAVWYRYTQNGQEKTGKFEKQLGKITLINPG